MDARTSWKILSGNRRNANKLRYLRREFFEEPLREVRRLLADYVAERPRKADDFMVIHWRNEIRKYLDFLRRIDEGILACEERVSAAQRELR
ncbi:MAG: hypothetical protein WC551_06605 [Patescibacteria group bacterium]